MKKEAWKRKVDPSRLVFAERAPMNEHLARYKLADLFIDTFACNAHTTTTEALWTGLPVVTKMGQGFAARVAGSLLNAVGLPALITKNEQDYEALILELAANPSRLATIKEKLAANCLTQPLLIRSSTQSTWKTATNKPIRTILRERYLRQLLLRIKRKTTHQYLSLP